jgi:hypothetical protein
LIVHLLDVVIPFTVHLLLLPAERRERWTSYVDLGQEIYERSVPRSARTKSTN